MIEKLVFGRFGLNSSVFEKKLISYSCISFIKHCVLRSFCIKLICVEFKFFLFFIFFYFLFFFYFKHFIFVMCFVTDCQMGSLLGSKTLGTKCIRTSICNVLANHNQNIESRSKLAQSVFIHKIEIE